MAEGLALEDTNMALFGTDIEKNLRYKNAENEPEWHKIPKEECLKIWRIEKFCVVPWPEKMYGTFYNGDSFIILSIKKVNESLDYTAYMWVGKQSTKDETGTAAYKIVELDDFFHGGVDLCYEAQDNESEDFRNLFEEIIVEEGGIESGFKKIEEEKWDVRLLRVYYDGKVPRTEEVPLNLSSLTQEDAFILDTGLDLYAWRGEKTAPKLKYSTCIICQKIKDPKVDDSKRGINIGNQIKKVDIENKNDEKISSNTTILRASLLLTNMCLGTSIFTFAKWVKSFGLIWILIFCVIIALVNYWSLMNCTIASSKVKQDDYSEVT